jgi:hypothetical protein
MRLQEEQRALISVMAGVMPGQKNEDSALEHIMVTLWWAECSADRILFRKDGGITIQSLYRQTPSNSVRLSRYWWYGRSSAGRSLGRSGNPSWIIEIKPHMSGSLADARRISFHVTDLMISVVGETDWVQI